VTFAEPSIDVDKLRAYKQGVVDKAHRRRRQRCQVAQGEVRSGTRDADRPEVAQGRWRVGRDAKSSSNI
jgi:hypothetical protein